jgi:hypothetical protein
VWQPGPVPQGLQPAVAYPTQAVAKAYHAMVVSARCQLLVCKLAQCWFAAQLPGRGSLLANGNSMYVRSYSAGPALVVQQTNSCPSSMLDMSPAVRKYQMAGLTR